MNLAKHLDIFLITYNRKDDLLRILSFILADNSPVRDCTITILDNCSTDGTSEFLKKLSKDHSNITHILHPHNVGGNVNYVKAVELVNPAKPYFWVLCDDDLIDWTTWKDVEEALFSGQYDLLQIYKGQGEIFCTFPELTFIPGAIYSSTLVDGDVINSMYMHLYTMFPQLVLTCKVYNEKKKVFYSSINIMNNEEKDLKEYNRGIDPQLQKGIGNIFCQINWLSGLCQALEMLEDKKFARKIIKSTVKRIYPRHEEFYYKYSPYFFDGYYWQFIGPVWGALPLWDKLIFPWMMLICRTKAGYWLIKGWRIIRTSIVNKTERQQYWDKIKNKSIYKDNH